MPPDRPTGLHPGEPGHGLARHAAIRASVALQQRPVEHLGDLLGDIASPPPPPWAGPGPVARSGVLARPRRRARATPRRRRRRTGRPHGEVDLEGVSKACQCVARLHQGGGQHVLERLAILERDLVNGPAASRCSVSETGRPAARSSPTKPARSSSSTRLSARAVSSSLAARSMSLWYLSRMCRVSLAVARVDRLDAEHHQRARPVEGLGHRGGLAQLERPEGADDAGHLVGQLAVDPGDPGPDDVALAFEVGIVEVQVETPALERLGQLPGVVRGEEDHRHRVARTVPSSGIDTWYSERISSSRASVSSSTRSTSSTSSTTGSSARMASSSGRVRRNSSEKMSSSQRFPRGGRRGLRRARRRRDPTTTWLAWIRAAACGSSTRRAPWTRPGPRSTATG